MSLAGVITNLILAYIFVLLLHIADGMNIELFFSAAAVNVVLAVFNLIPIPPLDGSHVFKYVLPRDIRPRYEALGFQGMFLVLIFLLIGRPYLQWVYVQVLWLLAILGGHG